MIIKNIKRLGRKLIWGLLDFNERLKQKREWKKVRKSVDPERWTHYPDLPRKSKKQVFKELEAYCMGGGALGWKAEQSVDLYFLFGLDRIGVDAASFVGGPEYETIRNETQSQLAHLLTYKQEAAIYFRACGIRVSCPIGVVRGGVLAAADNSFEESLAAWLAKNPGWYFLKPNSDAQGRGCVRLEVRRTETGCEIYGNGVAIDRDGVESRFDDYVIEPLLIQHEQLRKISPHAVFPIRIRTIRNEAGVPEFLSAYICMAWKESTFANICHGRGIAFAVDKDGYGISDAIVEPDNNGGRGGRFACHPETGDRFIGYKVPMMHEVIGLALKAHGVLRGVHSVGWDVAILDDGPIIIEGNPDWGVFSYQALMGVGEREIFEKRIKPYPEEVHVLPFGKFVPPAEF